MADIYGTGGSGNPFLAVNPNNAYTNEILNPRFLNDKRFVEFWGPDSYTKNMFNGNELQFPDTNHCELVAVDYGYLEDYDDGRYTDSTRSGSAFGVSPQKPRTYRTRYSLSRHRSYWVIDFQMRNANTSLKQYMAEWMLRQTKEVLVPEFDKYSIFAVLNGHMSGKYSDGADNIGFDPTNENYVWLPEVGESSTTEIIPSFASITAVEKDPDDIKNTIQAIDTLWYDSFVPASEQRFLCVTKSIYYESLRTLVTQNLGTSESYTIQINGSFGEKIFGYDLVIIPTGYFPVLSVNPDTLEVLHGEYDTAACNTPGLSEDGVKAQVVGFFALKSAAQVIERWNQSAEEDGSVKFNGTEKAFDVYYDAWVLEHKSIGIVPIVELIEEDEEED